MSESRPPDHFQRLYAENEDPWGFTTSAYEQAKYAHTIETLGAQRFASGLEVGCSIGVLTRMLADRCDRLLGLDIVEQPLQSARQRCADRPWVRFQQAQVPRDWPDDRFDLIVFSEVLYFLSHADIEACARHVLATALPQATIVLVNWLGPLDDPTQGEHAADIFLAAGCFPIRHQSRTDRYRLDVITPPS